MARRRSLYLPVRQLGIAAVLASVLVVASCGTGKVPQSALKEYLHGEDFYLRGQTEAAAAIFTRVSDEYPAFYQARFMEAKSLYLLNRSREAERVLTSLVERFPQYHEAQIWLARVEVERGETAAADKRLSGLLTWDSRDPRLLYLMAMVRIDENRLQEAITYLHEAAAYGDQLAQVHLQLGRLYYRFGLSVRAREELNRALVMLPSGSPLAGPVRQLLAKIPAKE